MSVTVRPARREELGRVNELRRMVSDLHVAGRPDIFRPGFVTELSDRIYELYDSDDYDIFVAEIDSAVCGFAIVNTVQKPQSPYNVPRTFFRVEEFGVDENYRRMGAATALIEYTKSEAKARGLSSVELDVWEFNSSALEFYEAVGFSTYRRYMEMKL